MDELKKKMHVLSILKKKNSVDFDGVAVQFKAANQNYLNEYKVYYDLLDEFKVCNQRIVRAMKNQLDINYLRSLNEYVDELETKIKNQKIILKSVEMEKDKLKSELLQIMSKGKVFGKAYENSEIDYSNELNKRINKEAEDAWVSRRYK